MKERQDADFVLGLLAERLVAAKTNPAAGKGATGGVVFLLGAGCSMQYGLPGFTELLQLAHRDLTSEAPEESWGLSPLREVLDRYWRVRKASELRTLLCRCLTPISGVHCAGYRRLAWLAQKGYVRHVVNMNFDLLLEEALEAERQRVGRSKPGFEVRQSFVTQDGTAGADAPTIVYKLHGSLKPGDGKPILDIVKSDLFEQGPQEKAIQHLLRDNDVVLIGYTGGDAKIARALRPPEDPPAAGNTAKSREAETATTTAGTVESDAPSRRPEVQPSQIFVLNVSEPSPHLLAIMDQRQSQELSIVGNDAAFENVMEILQAKVQEVEKQRAERKKGRTVAHVPVEDDQDEETRSAGRGKPKARTSPHFTQAESEALDQCRRLAIGIRSTMTIAETSPSSIEEHADDLFKCCLDIAANAHVALTPPEKYLLHCAAYLHDLGYFSAYGQLYSGQQSGWSFLNGHGRETAMLLRKYLLDGTKLSPSGERILPKTYFSDLNHEPVDQAEDLRVSVVDHLIRLCLLHSRPATSQAPTGSTPVADDAFEIEIRGCPVTVRPKLILALFIAAEEISEGHPFLPSPYPLELVDDEEGDKAKEASGDPPRHEDTIEDPILDLYLRLKPREVSYKIQPGRILASLDGKTKKLSRAAVWLWSVAIEAVEFLSSTLSQVQEEYWRSLGKTLPTANDDLSLNGMQFVYEAPEEMPDLKAFKEYELLRAALEERFSLLVRSPTLDLTSQGGVASMLDLVAIFTIPKSTRPVLGVDADDPTDPFDGEVVLPTDAGSVEKVLQDVRRSCVADAAKIPAEGLLYHYFMASSGDQREEPLESQLIATFQEIYYPGWRFLAAQWRSEVDAVVMARAAIEYGSSRFRDEVIGGIRHLLEDKVPWHAEPEDGCLRAHQGCTICGSRLIYVFATVRRLMPDPKLRGRLTDAHGRSSDEVACGLLRTFMGRDELDKAWWGLEEAPRHTSPGTQGRATGRVRAADYLAWAARATAFAIAVDEEVRERAGGGDADGWFEEMELDRADVHRLFTQRWEALLGATAEDLVNQKAEEPHSYIVGEVATTLLTVERLARTVVPLASIVTPDAMLRAVGPIQKAVNDLGGNSSSKLQLSQLSRFFLWPAKVFLERFGPFAGSKQRDQLRRELVLTFKECFESPVWIRSPGSGRGSWGYNLENTQRLNSALATFWRRVLEDREAFEPIFEDEFRTGGKKAGRAKTGGSKKGGPAEKRPASRTKKRSSKTPK